MLLLLRTSEEAIQRDKSLIFEASLWREKNQELEERKVIGDWLRDLLLSSMHFSGNTSTVNHDYLEVQYNQIYDMYIVF